MADPDAESAVLIRELTRELNGLTRGRSRGAAERPSKRLRGPDSPSRSPPLEGTRLSSRTEEPSLRSPAGARRPSPADAGAVKPLRRLRKQSSSNRKDGSDQGDSQQPLRDEPPRAEPLPAESEPGILPPPRSEVQWTEEQAFCAAAEAKDKAREAGRNRGRDRFKCFCSGVPWGLKLPLEALHSREALADALEQGFTGENLQLDSGKRLHAIFLDSEGEISVYPPAQTDESWKGLAPSITRAYVCRA